MASGSSGSGSCPVALCPPGRQQGRIPGCIGKVETSGSFSACSYFGDQPCKGFGETWLQDPDLELISAVSFESKLITVGFGITMLVGKAAKTPLLS